MIGAGFVLVENTTDSNDLDCSRKMQLTKRMVVLARNELTLNESQADLELLVRRITARIISALYRSIPLKVHLLGNSDPTSIRTRKAAKYL